MSDGASTSGADRGNEPKMTDSRKAVIDPDEAAQRRERNRLYARAYRERRRKGEVWAWVSINPKALAGLERLGLLPVGDRSLESVSEAVAQFVQAAGAMAAVGDAIWPAPAR